MPKLTSRSQITPNLFLLSGCDKKNWRRIEIIVAGIESFLIDESSILKSSIKVKDIINSLEQIDIAYYDSNNTLSAFAEVRARKGKVGRNYIQEIIGKKKSLSISGCKLISTIGFTRDARKLANLSSIALRTLELVVNTNCNYWFQANEIIINKLEYQIDNVEAFAEVDHKEVVAKISGIEINTDNLLIKTERGLLIESVRDLFTFLVDQGDIPLTLDNDVVEEEIWKPHPAIIIDVPQNSLYISVNNHESKKINDIANLPKCKRFRFSYSLRKKIVHAPIIEKYNYLSADSTCSSIISEIVVGKYITKNTENYILILRVPINSDSCQLGAIVFQ